MRFLTIKVSHVRHVSTIFLFFYFIYQITILTSYDEKTLINYIKALKPCFENFDYKGNQIITLCLKNIKN
jgi:hypothetical protein